MLLNLTEEEKMIKDTARDFAQKELEPIVKQMDKEKQIPRAIIDKLSEIGFMGMNIPEKYNGSELGNFCLVLALEEINRICPSTGVTMSVHNSLASSPIVRFGSEEVKQKYLPKMAIGELIGAYALTEPNAGSDAASLELAAVKDGNDYVLNGTKAFITNGGIADIIVVFARTNPDKSLRHKGITAFVVEKDFEGFSAGLPEDKLGIRASNTVELVFDNCRVPETNIIGELNNGFKIAMDTLNGGRIGIATQALGIAQRCLDEAVKYSKERKQFGKFISQFQAIQFKIAEMATNIHAARLMIYHAAKLRDKKQPHVFESASAKLFASTIANDAARESLQIHGGVGYTTDFPIERFFRDAKITEIYEGTSEVQHIVIAKEFLR